jgi:hypothetical protein
VQIRIILIKKKIPLKSFSYKPLNRIKLDWVEMVCGLSTFKKYLPLHPRWLPILKIEISLNGKKIY